MHFGLSLIRTIQLISTTTVHNAVMRPFRSIRATWRHPNLNVPPERHITTSPATFANIRHELLSRPPITYQEQLHPGNTELLSISLPGLKLTKENHYAHLLSPLDHAVLPQGHHLVCFKPTHPTDSLLPDGTDPDHSPGPPFTRRLWAGGNVTFSPGWKSQLLTVGKPWVCRESVTGVRLKGASPGDKATFDIAPGPDDKILVDIERLYSVMSKDHVVNNHAIIERRTLCFMTPETPNDIQRALEQPANKTIKAPQLLPQGSPSSYSQSFTLTPAALFRFSALTFNAHKIHLDPQHCREVEGYRDLLVHGPLLLVLMFSALNSRGHIVNSLDYSNVAPVYVGEKIKVCVQQRKDKWSVWIAGPQDDLRVRGTVVLDRDAEDGGLFRLTSQEA